MIRIISISLLFLFASTVPTLGQSSGETFSTSAAYVEVGVAGIFGYLAGLNVSYEHRLFSNTDNNLHIYGRGGISGGGVLFGSGGFGGLIGGSLLTGPNNHHFEADLGLIVGKNEGSGGNDVFFQPILEAGYRYQRPQGGFLFKAKGGIIGFGIALGYAF